jgi:hypothetical protein
MEVAPAKGAVGVPSRTPIHIRFDRAMNRGSVNWRLKLYRLYKSGGGIQLGTTSFRWTGSKDVWLDHTALLPSTAYQVMLDPDYRDAQGLANSLRHSWVFTTEGPPYFASSSPSDGDQQVAPSAYISLTFSRQMDLSSLPQAISIAPRTRFRLERDPDDAWRVLVVPDSLLEPQRQYTVTVTSRAHDVDGNRLVSGAAVSFTTGPQRGLQHWIGFVAGERSGTASAGLWIVDENRLPRELVPSPVSWFTWSHDGQRVLIRSPAGAWTDQDLQGGATLLPIHAAWASYLGPGRGYAYLDGGSLATLSPRAESTPVASGVGDAAVDPTGTRIAYTVSGPHGTEVEAYDVGLHAGYRLATEAAPVDGLAWSPDGLSLAYRVVNSNPSKRQIRIRLLRDAGTTTTAATGPVSAPAWQADSRHVFFTAPVRAGSGEVSKLFRATAGQPALSSLTAATGLPAAPGVSVGAVSTSPDGRQVAFLSTSGGDVAQVWLMNADGTGLSRLTTYQAGLFPYLVTQLAWTPT